ncbi:Proline--tRNA ligase [Cucumispora dikerogammari]|nr:Proline--tRNA ligase [Cucumispora dikerogammari]
MVVFKDQTTKPNSSKLKNKTTAGNINKTESAQFGLRFKKEDNFTDWYTDILLKSEMIEYYSIKGCYILRPTSMFLWNSIRDFFDSEIKKLGVKDVYFPSLVTQEALEKEATHVEGFAPELAWITKAGDQDIQPIALRPTSETIIYPSFSKWIQSHRDLPLKVNQWCNVFRWEVKSTLPFIRSREFLWQEGHTAYYTSEAAEKEVLVILELYRRIFEEILAVPAIKGIKTEGEKFCGADYTTSLETFIPESGKGVQAATSHFLGQNFSKMFDIKVQDVDLQAKVNNLHITDNEKQPVTHKFVYQNSWGITTRSIGIAVMIHGDDKGLVLPPKIAPTQVVIIPCGLSNKVDCSGVFNACKEMEIKLKHLGIRVKYDDRDNITAGYKFMHYELHGVPFRMEIGLKDIKNGTCKIKRRFDDKIENISLNSADKFIFDSISSLHDEMLNKAKTKRNNHFKILDRESDTLNDFNEALNNKNMVLARWCQNMECEESIRKRSTVLGSDSSVILMGAKSLCIPFQYKDKQLKGTCIGCEKDAVVYCLFGRSY